MKKQNRKQKILRFITSPWVISGVLIILISFAFGLKKQYSSTIHQAAPELTSEQCEVIKYRYFTGSYLAKPSKKPVKIKSPEEVKAMIDQCSTLYAEAWKKLPSRSQCTVMARFEAQGTLSAMVAKGRLDGSNVGYCQAKVMKVRKCEVIAKYKVQRVLTAMVQSGNTNIEWIDVLSCKEELKNKY